jgi:hypothetical protein
VIVKDPFLSSSIEDFFRRLFLDALGEIGNDREALLRLIAHETEFRNHMLTGLRTLSSRVPNYEIARSSLGEDFISPEEVMRARNVVYTHKQFSHLDDTAPNQRIIEWCRENGYVLVPGPNRPMSLVDVRRLNPEYFSERFFCEEDWLPGVTPFAHFEKVGVRWIAFRKEPVPGSAIRGWEDQLSLVLDCEAVPNVAEVAWCITTYKAVRGIRLFPNMFVRTSSRDSNGSHVCFGNDTRNGGSLTIYPWSDTHRSESVSLATVRNKF